MSLRSFRAVGLLLALSLVCLAVIFTILSEEPNGWSDIDVPANLLFSMNASSAITRDVVSVCSKAVSHIARRSCIITRLLKPLAAEPAIEIGGPSNIYNGDPYRIYQHLERCDNVRFGGSTLWERDDGGVYHWVRGKPKGRQFILDAVNLSGIADASYSVVMSSHNLEHLVNPLKAIAEQKRILRPLGVLIITLPNKELTFDHRRPTATLQELIEDYRRNTPESDLSHLDQILKLHDIGRDPGAGDLKKFRDRSLDNAKNRALHQHVFDAALMKAVLEFHGFSVATSDHTGVNIFTIAVRSEVP